MSIGYACINIGSTNTKLKSLRLSNATNENLLRVIEHNLSALEAMIEYNIQNDIKLFRISSEIIPFGSHPMNQFNWQHVFSKRLQELGESIDASHIRVSMHPGQYTVINSPNEDVVQRAFADLEYHSKFLEMLGCDESCKIVIHVGGRYNDKKSAIKRFIKNYHLVRASVKNRLVIENDDKIYSIEDVLNISKIIGAPVVFDNLHHLLNAPEEFKSVSDWIDECAQTWSSNDGVQKIHYSQRSKMGKRGAHSATIESEEFLAFYCSLRTKSIDIMLEVKDKNLSALKCTLLTSDRLHIKHLEKEWAKYKYLVLSRSAEAYNEIRSLLKDKSNPDALHFYKSIEWALAIDGNVGAGVNAAQHIWGYLNKTVAENDRKRYDKLVSGYRVGTVNYATLKKHLLKLASKQKVDYLLNSLYFYL